MPHHQSIAFAESGKNGKCQTFFERPRFKWCFLSRSKGKKLNLLDKGFHMLQREQPLFFGYAVNFLIDHF